MRTSRYPLSTLREAPADAETASHKLMLRAALINKVASGLYTWLPLGVRVLRKIETIVREEMNRAGALEMLMPAVQPADLWKKSGRWYEYGEELLKFQDRHKRDMVLGPTHEEVITELVRSELATYRQLPVNFYQIQTKFRDEIRPRFGVMRAREFLMKDAYSFHCDAQSLDETYEDMRKAYCRIFDRIGLDYRYVQADMGNIGGVGSHEFHALADCGEDAIAFSTEDDYAANVELAPVIDTGKRAPPAETIRLVDTPGVSTIANLSESLKIPPSRCLKALFLKGKTTPLVAVFVRGDHEMNLEKAKKHPLLAEPICFSTPEEIKAVTGASPGSLGPVNLRAPVLVDQSAACLSDFACGANQDGKHYLGVNWDRDVDDYEIHDLRCAVAGDPSPSGAGSLTIRRGIEVGHIFKLGKKYSECMSATVHDEQGEELALIMGCYGIGISRIVAACIEQSHDAQGIIWPRAIAPFTVMISPLGFRHTPQTLEVAERLYQELLQRKVEVLLDDRDVRPGVMFADADLIGIPWRLTVGPRNLERQIVEYTERASGLTKEIALDDCVDHLMPKLEITS